jgi:hypothetical protein
MEFVLILVAFLVVVWVVSVPLRSGHVEETERRESAELAELEAAKEAKYREIRDAEMDFRTGKLDKADHRALDRQLRAEAIQLLRRIDGLKPATADRTAPEAAEAAEPAGAAGEPGAAGGPEAAGPSDTPRSDARVG